MESLCAAIFAKVDEQIERTRHLVALLPADRLEWHPPIPGAWPAGVLLGHLLESLAGFCAVLFAVEPGRLRHFADLRQLPVNHSCGKSFEVLQDVSLGRPVPTIFTSEGESVLTLLLGNLEHLINHKHQLFVYLKLLGVNASSRDLYRFRGQ
jgi:hypothetical protein